jgi:putative phage-type endonuclease
MTIAQWTPPGVDADEEFQLAEDVIHQHANVVGRTDTMERPEWLRMRKVGIGASDAAPALGLSPWGSPFSVWVDKTSDEISDEETERQKWGRRLELPIMLGVAEDTGIPVRQFPFMVQSKEWPWMTANLDGISPRSNVEVKNVDRFMAEEWDDGAVPMHYMIQGQHSNAVTGHTGTHFFPLIGGNTPRPVYVERNDRLIEDLVESERQFWELVKDLEMPSIDGLRGTKAALGRMYGNPEIGSDKELPHEALGLIEQRSEVMAKIKELNEVKDEVENRLKAWLGHAEIGTVNGLVVFTWKGSPRSGYYVEPKEMIRSIHVPKNPKPLNPER